MLILEAKKTEQKKGIKRNSQKNLRNFIELVEDLKATLLNLLREDESFRDQVRELILGPNTSISVPIISNSASSSSDTLQ